MHQRGLNVSFKAEHLCLSLHLGIHKNTSLYTDIRDADSGL